MSTPRTVAAACVGVLALLVGAATELRADPILEIIDIRPVVNLRNIGNALGLAFNPDSNVLYLAHGSDPSGGFIYTLDVHGNLLKDADGNPLELDLQSAYKAGAFPESLSYDRRSGHLFVIVTFPDVDELGPHFVSHLVEIDPSTWTILNAAQPPVIDIDGGGGMTVRDDGIWQTRFSEDRIRHYARDVSCNPLAPVACHLDVVEDVSVAGSFPDFPGPVAVTSSFVGGFFIVDPFGERIVEVDIAGNEVAAVSTAGLGDGRGLAIESDASTQRIFLQVNNETIYVLSAEFIKAIPTVVSIDIKPGSFRNKINPKSHGKISVAILTTSTFDATTVSPGTVRFGHAGTEAAPVRSATRDVDGDGLTDLILRFNIEDTDIQCGQDTALLTGETFGGQAIQGTGAIMTVRCRWHRPARHHGGRPMHWSSFR